jgi:hypothetical protein
MALTNGQTKQTYLPRKTMFHALNSDEAGSGVVFLQLSTDSLPTTDYATFASVNSISGVVRTLTNKYYDKTTGYISVTGTGYAEGDLLHVQGIRVID